MTKAPAARPMVSCLTALAVLGLGTLMLNDLGGASLPGARVSIDRGTVAVPQQLTTPGGLPNVSIETTDGTRTTFAATDGHVRIAVGCWLVRVTLKTRRRS